MKTNTLLEGPIGSGKTHALRTIVAAGKELFVLATEPGIDAILGDLPDSKCHWKYIPPGKIPWDIMRRNAEMANKMDAAQLVKMAGINKDQYTQFLDVFSCLADFECDRCGESFGPVDHWDESRCLAVDGLTGISQMSSDLVVGAKPIKSQPEWGIAMNQILVLTNKLCYDTKCNFVLISHIERDRDELSGRSQIRVATLGNKLAPEIPKPFNEVIYARREVDQFFWSTVEPDVDLKVRILPWSDSIKPDFNEIFSLADKMEAEGKKLPTMASTAAEVAEAAA